MTDALLPIALVLLLLLLAGWWWMRRRHMADRQAESGSERLDTIAAWPPQATRILTTSERLAYSTLVRALPDHMVLAQVPLSRFIKVPKRHSHAEWLRRLGNQCVDLVVCDTASQVVAVVDLQPAGGVTNDRMKKRATRIARSLKAAGVPLHIWTEGVLPSLDAARQAILPRPVATLVAPAAPAGITPVAPARPAAPGASPFDDSRRDSALDEVIEAPPSTWFDDLDSGPTPLQKPPRR